MAQDTYDADEIQLVVFKLGREEYAVSILQVQEIKRLTDITRVPDTPDYITGVINLRGSVLPVINLKKRLNLPQQNASDHTRIMIVKIDEILVGVLVDAVSEVLAIDRLSIEKPDAVVGEIAANYISGVGKLDNRLLILLNMDAIIAVNQDAKAS